MAAAQGLDFRTFTPGRGTRAAKAEIRKHVAFLDEGPPAYPDHNAMMPSLDLDILRAVGKRVGKLAIY